MSVKSETAPEILDPSADQATGFDPQTDHKDYAINEGWKKHRPPEYFDYRKAWDEVPRNKIELDFPLHVDIETTDVCNLQCPMCPRTIMDAAGELENRLMTRDDYAMIIDQVAEHGAKAIKLNYNGEPLAHKDLFWQVEYAKNKGIVDVLINTNATLLDKKKGTRLLKAGIDGVFVSFDAVSPDVFAKQRVGTTMGKVVDNLLSFVNLRNEIRPGCQIRVSMVLYEGEFWDRQFDGLRTMWENIVDTVGYSVFTDYRELGAEPFPKVEGWWCSQPFQRMVLKVNGNITVCCPDNWDELCVGNWRDERLHDVWHGEKFRSIRRKHAEGKYYDLDRCSRCSYAHLEKRL